MSADGRTLASCDRLTDTLAKGMTGLVHLWELPSGKSKGKLTGSPHPVDGSIAISADGRFLAAGGWNYQASLWELGKGAEPRSLIGHKGSVRGVDFAPDARRLASCASDGTVKLWTPETGQEIATFKPGGDPWEQVRFAPDGRTLALGSNAGALRLIDAVTGAIRATLTGHAGAIRGLAFTRDGRTLLSGDAKGKVLLWDVSAFSGPPKAGG